jgi:hypothetical protein
MTWAQAKWLLGLAAVLAVAVYGYLKVCTAHETSRVETMTTKMKTVCVGRFLLDLPADTETGLTAVFVDGFHVTVTNETTEQFKARLSSREAAINATRNQLGRKNMESVQIVDVPGLAGRVFTFGRSSSYTMEGDVRRDWVAVNVEGYAHAGAHTFNFIAEDYDAALVGHLGKLLRQLRLVAPDNIPTEPGFCFGPGMLLDPIPASAAEKIVMFASFPRHPDVALAFNTMAGLTVAWPSLLKRRAKVVADRPITLRSHFSTLRAGPRLVHGLAGEEMATRVTELNSSTAYGFDWELPGTEDDLLLPAAHLEMSIGNSPAGGDAAVQSSLHQEAALALWDKILSSLRVRQTQATRVDHPAQQAGPEIGATALAGHSCPQAGWWACADGDEKLRVLGGDRQYLRKGQLMPQALLMPSQTLWQKVRGVQPTVENDNPTLWRLADRRFAQRRAEELPLAPPTPATPGSIPTSSPWRSAFAPNRGPPARPAAGGAAGMSTHSTARADSAAGHYCRRRPSRFRWVMEEVSVARP